MTRKAKIRFIEPQGRGARPLNVFISRWPLIGPILLATILDKRGYDARTYNENVSGPIEENAEAWRDVCSADVVALTIMTPTAPRGYTIADRLRVEAPSARIAFGGVHATFMPEEALPHGDIVCRGEGEHVIEAIARGDIRSGIVPTEPLVDLDELPAPDFTLMRDFDKLLSRCYKRELYEMPIMSSRGCPYGCTYCSVTRMFGRKIRRRSVAKTIEDVEHYMGQGFQTFYFYDDNFLSDREWARDLLRRMAPLKSRFQAAARVDFSWTDSTRTRRDEDLLHAMENAGCLGLLLGYETLDDDTAKEWNKGYLPAGGKLESRLFEDTRILHVHGIWSYGMFVLGPRHDRRTTDRILRFARRSELHSLQVSMLTPFPGTPLFDKMRPHLFLTDFPGDWDFYDGAHCTFNNGKLTPEEYQRLVLEVHKQFYRLGGWTPRSLRTVANRSIAIQDKVMDYVARVVKNRDVFNRWEVESDAYIDMIRQRGART